MRPAGEIKYIDFHTHLTGATGRIPAAGGQGTDYNETSRAGYMTGNDIITIINLMAGEDVPAAFPHGTLFSAGIHPWQLTGDNLPQLQTELLLTAAHPHVVIIGEAGFDRLRGAQGEVQYRAFLFQAQIAEEMGKPMVIHCVKGWDELRRARREVRPGRPWVIHGFRGSGTLAASLAEEGFWFSLGARGVTPEVLASVSHDRLMLETDDSGLPVTEVYRLFSEAAGYDEAAVQELIMNNFNSLFKFSM